MNDMKVDEKKLWEDALKNVLEEYGLTKDMSLKDCVEKQVAKKPSFEGDGYADGYLVYDTWICPCCEKHYEVDYEEYDFCPNCGQKIDWEGGAE